MPKITQDQKEKFLELYRRGYRGFSISKMVGISLSHAKRIIESFDAGDFSWIDNSFRRYSRAFREDRKLEIVKGILNSSKTFADHVAETGIPEGILCQWIRNYTVHGVCTLKGGRPRKDGSDDRGAEEDQRAGEREHYLEDILPGLRGKRDGSSKKKILRTVGECRELGIPLRECLKALRLSSSTYHFWRRHEKDSDEKDLALARAIREVQNSSHWAYGAKRMARCLVSEGLYDRINHKRVERVMDSYDLHARIRRRRYPKNYYLTLKEKSEQLPGNILSRDFVSAEPCRKFVTDITYLPTKEGWLYLAAVMDLYNHEIVSYRTSRRMELGLVTGVILQMKERGIHLPGTLIHSDMGWTYTNRVYVDCLKDLGVRQSMSRKGNCWDNACIENFFGLFKSETIRQRSEKELLSVDEMDRLVDDYICWFNNRRIQKKLGYLSPVNYRKLAT